MTTEAEIQKIKDFCHNSNCPCDSFIENPDGTVDCKINPHHQYRRAAVDKYCDDALQDGVKGVMEDYVFTPGSDMAK